MSNSEFPQFDLGLIDKAREAAEKDRKKALEVHPHIQGAIAFLEALSGEDRETKERLAVKAREAKEFLNNHLRHEVPAVRRAVWTAILCYELRRPETRSEVEEVLAALVTRGLLVENEGGHLRAYGKAYIVRPESTFGPDEKISTETLLRNLLSEIKEEFLKRSTLPLRDLLDGKPGMYTMSVPPEKIKQNGEETWKGGGVLRVRSDGTYLFPEEAMGSIEGGVSEARKLGVKLLVKSLKQSQPPFIEKVSPEIGGKARLMWYLIKRAQRLAGEKEKILNPEGAITTQEFFLGGQHGACPLEIESEPWEVKDADGKVTNRIYNVFFRVRREEKEGVKMIHIVAIPTHLVDFFDQCLAEEGYPEGDRFGGCPQPLQAVLRAAYGQASKAEKDVKKAAAIAVPANA